MISTKMQNWITYVSMNHHKTRDKQFVVSSYISDPLNTYHIAHFDSYLVDENYLGPERKTYEEALNDITHLLDLAISDSIYHNNMILKNPDRYDDIDVKQAEYFNLHLGYKYNGI